MKKSHKIGIGVVTATALIALTATAMAVNAAVPNDTSESASAVSA